MNAYLLLIFGLILVYLEFYLPGAILGILGSALLLASIMIFIVEHDSWISILLFIIALFSLLTLLIKFALWQIRNAKPNSSIYLSSSQEGYKASHFDETAIGKKAIVLSDLKPGGFILIDGKQLQAISETGYIEKGSEVIVIGGQETSLIVKQFEE